LGKDSRYGIPALSSRADPNGLLLTAAHLFLDKVKQPEDANLAFGPAK